MKAMRRAVSQYVVYSLAVACLVSGVSPASADVQIDPDPIQTIVQNEISLTLVHRPAQSDVLIAAYNDNPGGSGIGYSYSSDGGASWTSGQLAFPMNTTTFLSMTHTFDPATASDTQGNAYIGHIAWDALGYSGMFVRKSVDGGVTWLPEVAVAIDPPALGIPDATFRLNDRCQMVADTFAGSPYTDNVYVAWIKDRGNDPAALPFSDIYVSNSNDLGTTFTPAQRINDVGLSAATWATCPSRPSRRTGRCTSPGWTTTSGPAGRGRSTSTSPPTAALPGGPISSSRRSTCRR